MSKVKGKSTGLPIVHQHAAGIDIGSRRAARSAAARCCRRTPARPPTGSRRTCAWLQSPSGEPIWRSAPSTGDSRRALARPKLSPLPRRKSAIHFYNAMRFGTAYVDRGAGHYEQHYRDRVIKNLHRRAAEFGFALQRVETVSLRKNKKNPIPRYRV